MSDIREDRNWVGLVHDKRQFQEEAKSFDHAVLLLRFSASVCVTVLVLKRWQPRYLVAEISLEKTLSYSIYKEYEVSLVSLFFLTFLFFSFPFLFLFFFICFLLFACFLLFSFRSLLFCFYLFLFFFLSHSFSLTSFSSFSWRVLFFLLSFPSPVEIQITQCCWDEQELTWLYSFPIKDDAEIVKRLTIYYEILHFSPKGTLNV